MPYSSRRYKSKFRTYPRRLTRGAFKYGGHGRRSNRSAYGTRRYY